MSRKIGLGDTFFDPDIDGDIDYDFFGGGTTATPAAAAKTTAVIELQEPTDPVKQGTSEALLNAAVRNLLTEPVIINNNYDYDNCKHGNVMRNLNQSETVATREKITESTDGLMATTNMGKKESAMMNGDHGDAILSTTVNSDVKRLAEVEGSLSKKSDFLSCENYSAEVRNAEEDDNEGAGVQTKLSSSRLPEENPQPSDEEEGSGLSDCDSASDLYSLTDDDEADEENEGDLDSDITEVSPLSSANMSPLPYSPKRTPEPKAKRYTSKLMLSPKLGDRSRKESSVSSSSSSTNSEINLGKKKQGSTANEENPKQDSVDLTVLAKAILELEEERRTNSNRRNKLAPPDKPYVRPKKNMTFTNEEVRRIDHENKRLLRRIIDSQKPRKASQQHPVQTGRVASSAINRFKELKKIETENLVLLKRLQATKPTRELSREFLLGPNQRKIPESKSSSSIPTMRTASPFVMSLGAGAGKGRGGRCCSMGSLHSNSSSWSTSTASPTKSKSSKLATNGLGTSHSIASGQ